MTEAAREIAEGLPATQAYALAHLDYAGSGTPRMLGVDACHLHALTPKALAIRKAGGWYSITDLGRQVAQILSPLQQGERNDGV